ncbi:Protein rer1b [Turnera subulata]|uniref:Protein rer1b n=1 Tax=Turnera subulata TaxID=218843 RepID=A0A9Q0JIN3_9ROSI|nr:Protein rer1b [Turnera subulata]
MEGGGGGGGAGGGIGGVDAELVTAPIAKWRNDFSRAFQYYLDRSTPHPMERWIGTAVAAAIYVLRVYFVQGFYIVSYGLGIYILNLLIGFLSPKVDPELEQLDGAALPTKDSDEFKPFIRRLPEFKFWYAITKAFCVAFLMTFFSVFDVPVFWPILLCYWIVLFVLTMKRQITHMIKYKYVPFSIGKQRYDGKNSASSSGGGVKTRSGVWVSGRPLLVEVFRVLTIVTPTLIYLSESSKADLLDVNVEKNGTLKARRMIGHTEKQSRTETGLMAIKEPATPAPASLLELVSEIKEAILTKFFRKI